MTNYTLEILGLKRELPVVALSPKIKVASFNLLGDGELTDKAAQELAKKLETYEFDVLVGPEVKVVPLLQSLARLTYKPRYIVLRKKIHGYMVNPLQLSKRPTLVVNGLDASLLRGKKAVVVDDVVSTGSSLRVARELVEQCGGEVVAFAVILRQGDENLGDLDNLICIGSLPLL